MRLPTIFTCVVVGACVVLHVSAPPVGVRPEAPRAVVAVDREMRLVVVSSVQPPDIEVLRERAEARRQELMELVHALLSNATMQLKDTPVREGPRVQYRPVEPRVVPDAWLSPEERPATWPSMVAWDPVEAPWKWLEAERAGHRR